MCQFSRTHKGNFSTTVFANLSEEVSAKIKEEMNFSGPVRMSDVEEVQLNIVRMIRQLDRDGEVKIVRNKNDKFV